MTFYFSIVYCTYSRSITSYPPTWHRRSVLLIYGNAKYLTARNNPHGKNVISEVFMVTLWSGNIHAVQELRCDAFYQGAWKICVCDDDAKKYIDGQTIN